MSRKGKIMENMTEDMLCAAQTTILELKKEISRLISNNRLWIKTTDQMPPENEFVLLFNGHWRGVGKRDRENFDAEFDNECEQWQDETTDYIVPVPTHWMPLPAPPVAE